MYPKHKTLKLLENNIREKVDDFGFGNDVLDPTPKAQSIKKKLVSLKWLKVKKKKNCSVKDTVRKIKSHRLGENIHKTCMWQRTHT